MSVAFMFTVKFGQTLLFCAGVRLVIVGKLVSLTMPQADPLVVEWLVTQAVKSL